MMNKISKSFQVLAKGPPASHDQVAAMMNYFGSIPKEYVDLVLEATAIELEHRNGQYVRIWGPTTCMDMDEGYGIRQWIPEAFPIGDDGGGRIIFYADGNRGSGLYHVGYGALDLDEAIWIAPTLTDLLVKRPGPAAANLSTR